MTFPFIRQSLYSLLMQLYEKPMVLGLKQIVILNVILADGPLLWKRCISTSILVIKCVKKSSIECGLQSFVSRSFRNIDYYLMIFFLQLIWKHNIVIMTKLWWQRLFQVDGDPHFHPLQEKNWTFWLFLLHHFSVVLAWFWNPQ